MRQSPVLCRRQRRPRWKCLTGLLIAASGGGSSRSSIFGVLCCGAAPTGDTAVAAAVKGDDDATTTTLQCAGGRSGDVREIPQSWINDGYCDCPLDGKDEPDTGACSGSLSWPGIAAVAVDEEGR